jgi:hypothetical protein
MNATIKHCIVFFFLSLIGFISANAQVVETCYKPSIKTIQLFEYGNQQGLPVYKLNGGGRLELEFDDMDGDYKNYYYTYVLCDYNWQPVQLNAFDFIKGFTQNRINTYRYSNIAYKRYTHYQAFLPDQNSMPSKSGNYLLKVYLDGDTSKTVFTKQFLVLDQKALVSANVVQPFSSFLFPTHQRIKFTANIKDINSFSPAQQVKVVIMQNNRWDNTQRDITPTFVRGNVLEYNSEEIGIFPGGKEWRWLDLRSFRLLSDRIENGVYDKNNADFYLKTDKDREGERYIYFSDYNGMYNIVTFESINPFWQGDYANIHFSFMNPDGNPFPDKNIYLAGAFSNYNLSDDWKMTYNPMNGKYEATAYLKQGYYNYTYIAVDQMPPHKKTELEGNYWETENSYTILIYYKSFTDRNDQLIGVTTVNSRTDKPGFSF